MNKVNFVHQKHEQSPAARKQVGLIHKPMREKAPCGASVQKGGLFAHQSKCPQCKLFKAEHDIVAI